jgi:tRNA splicing ligase
MTQIYKRNVALQKRLDESMLKVIIVENKAYWVLNNVFYVADAFENQVNPETAKPVNVEDMSRPEMEKLLFILDSLKDGEVENDRSGSGNEGF